MFRRLQRWLQSLERTALNTKLAAPIASGLATGMVIGLLPKDSAFPYLLAVVALLLPQSLLAVLPSLVFFSLISPLLDSQWDQLGFQILSAPAFKPLGATLDSSALMHWTHFNNTVVMGSLVSGLLAWPVVFLIVRFAIVKLQGSLAENAVTASPNSLATEVDG